VAEVVRDMAPRRKWPLWMFPEERPNVKIVDSGRPIEIVKGPALTESYTDDAVLIQAG
jgi:hypothetical protein